MYHDSISSVCESNRVEEAFTTLYIHVYHSKDQKAFHIGYINSVYD